VRGVRFGRPLKLSPHQRREAIERSQPILGCPIHPECASNIDNGIASIQPETNG
jgi:hypothetical protein